MCTVFGLGNYSNSSKSYMVINDQRLLIIMYSCIFKHYIRHIEKFVTIKDVYDVLRCLIFYFKPYPLPTPIPQTQFFPADYITR